MIKIYVRDENGESFAQQAMAHQVAHNHCVLGAAFEIIRDTNRAGTIEGASVEVAVILTNAVFRSPLGWYTDFDLRR